MCKISGITRIHDWTLKQKNSKQKIIRSEPCTLWIADRVVMHEAWFITKGCAVTRVDIVLHFTGDFKSVSMSLQVRLLMLQRYPSCIWSQPAPVQFKVKYGPNNVWHLFYQFNNSDNFYFTTCVNKWASLSHVCGMIQCEDSISPKDYIRCVVNRLTKMGTIKFWCLNYLII